MRVYLARLNVGLGLWEGGGSVPSAGCTIVVGVAVAVDMIHHPAGRGERMMEAISLVSSIHRHFPDYLYPYVLNETLMSSCNR